MSTTDVSKLKVSELKKKLVALGEPTSGLKPEMVARLKAALAKQPAAASTAAAPAPPSTAEQHAFLDHAKKFEFDHVRALILKNPGYVNVQPCGRWTAVHQAAFAGDTATCEFLIEKGCDLKAKDSGGRNAWGIAHDWHKEEMLELFKRHGLEHKETDRLSFPPAPKWREGTRDNYK